MEGWEDPFNRCTYPWGREDAALRAFHILLGRLRRSRLSLQKGDIRYLRAEGHVLAFSRSWEGETTTALFNAGDAPAALELPWSGSGVRDALSDQSFSPADGLLRLELPPRSAYLLV